ncbi:MAG: 50S ribosomal protein L34e [Candidatus Aenigmatarchaeota archaeon]
MRRAQRTRTMKKTRVRTPGGETVIRIKKRRPGYHECGRCGAKLNRRRMRAKEIRKLPRTQRRPERPLPELCSRCMREAMKARVKG